MKKSLLITLDWPPNRGGVANYLWNIYSRLPRDFSVILVPPSISPPASGGARGGVGDKTSSRLRAPRSLGERVERGGKLVVYHRELLSFFWPKWLRAYFEAVKIIRNDKIEAVHLSHILPIGYVAWMIKKVLEIPYAVYLHGMDITLTQKSPWKRWWAKKILRGADLIVANSEFTAAEAIKAGAKKEKIEILYPCPNFSLPERSGSTCETDNADRRDASPAGSLGSARDDENKNIILSVGRLVERKGFDKVIEAMPEILRAVPDAEYQIVGFGPYAVELKNLAEKLGIGERVKFFSNISNTELPEFYKNCKIFAMPARQIGGDVEGFGIAYLEAALFGRPSVAGNVGGASEAVLNNQTGLTVNPEHSAEIAAAIIKLLKDDNLRQKLGEAAKARVASEFTWEKQINKIITQL